DRGGKEICAGPRLTGDHWLRVAGRHVDHVEVGVVSGRQPGHAAAVFHGLLARPTFRTRISHLLRYGVPPPLQVGGFGVVRFDIAGTIEIVAADARDDVVADY